MKHYFKSAWQIAYQYAKQIASYGYCHNLAFYGSVLFSYKWYAIARVFSTNTQNDFALIQCDKYSSTTARHINSVVSVLARHYNSRVIEVPCLLNYENYETVKQSFLLNAYEYLKHCAESNSVADYEALLDLNADTHQRNAEYLASRIAYFEGKQRRAFKRNYGLDILQARSDFEFYLNYFFGSVDKVNFDVSRASVTLLNVLDRLISK